MAKIRCRAQGGSKMGKGLTSVTLTPSDHQTTRDFFGAQPINGSFTFSAPDETADEYKAGDEFDVEITAVNPKPAPAAGKAGAPK